MTERCENCRYFKPDVKDVDFSPGRCRRNAPKAFPYHTMAATFTEYPRIASGDWCGEYARKETL